MSTGIWVRPVGIAVAMVSVLATGLGGVSATAATTGILQVTSSPSLATQILIDGVIANSRAVNGLELTPGVHNVSFTHVTGYTEPAAQGVNVIAGTTTALVGTFTPRGQLQVVTAPSVASEITIDGHPDNDFGVTTDVAAPAVHQVCFGAVKGFTPPACQSATTTTGPLPTIVTGVFLPSLTAVGQNGVGMLRVTSQPPVATQVLVDGQIADSWGLNWLELAPGTHAVCFAHLEGFTEPPCQNVAVVAGLTTPVLGSFAQRGELRVITSPAVPGTVSVDGVARDSWGIWTDLPAGLHTVCFGAVTGHANTPACQTISVNPGVETDVTGVYS
jgi:hypothetical protein